MIQRQTTCAINVLRGIDPAGYVGVIDFGQTLEEQGVIVVYVDWSPPAAGDQDMIDLLDQLL